MKIIADNRKAYFDYFIEDTYEAGIMLLGAEVKSIRLGNVSLKESYAMIRKDGIWLCGAHIAPYEKGSHFNEDSKRDRKLLLNKSEIDKLIGKVKQKGYTLVPTKMYFNKALVKIELGLAKGKELHDKRRSIKEKESKREVEREIKSVRNLK